jgi:hypothetical protein
MTEEMEYTASDVYTCFGLELTSLISWNSQIIFHTEDGNVIYNTILRFHGGGAVGRV